MGTRADFWINEGQGLEWLGSVAYDGYEWHGKKSLLRKRVDLCGIIDPQKFRETVDHILKKRKDKDATLPSDGWPWPWEDSNTTDYAYVFEDGKVNVFYYGSPVADEDGTGPKRSDWPNMKERPTTLHWEAQEAGLW